MYRIYFKDNKIINISDSTLNLFDNVYYYIDLFDININKEIEKTIKVQNTDMLGRLLFNNNLPIYHEEQVTQNIELIKNSEYFTIEDIINAKINQLKNKYNCNDVIYNNIFNNVNKSVNFIEFDNEIISNKINTIYNNLYIYIESPTYIENDLNNNINNLTYYISFDNKTFKQINNIDNIDINNLNKNNENINSFYLKIKTLNKTKINNIYLLFK